MYYRAIITTTTTPATVAANMREKGNKRENKQTKHSYQYIIGISFWATACMWHVIEFNAYSLCSVCCFYSTKFFSFVHVIEIFLMYFFSIIYGSDMLQIASSIHYTHKQNNKHITNNKIKVCSFLVFFLFSILLFQSKNCVCVSNNSNHASSLMNRCWHNQQNHRISCSRIFAHASICDA